MHHGSPQTHCLETHRRPCPTSFPLPWLGMATGVVFNFLIILYIYIYIYMMRGIMGNFSQNWSHVVYMGDSCPT